MGISAPGYSGRLSVGRDERNDSELERTGQNIEAFVEECVKNTLEE